jgi:hypothetical protein
MSTCLLSSNLSILLVNTVITDLVSALGGGNNTEVVAELVLLQELLGQVLEVSAHMKHTDTSQPSHRFWKATSVVTLILLPSRLMVTLPAICPVLPPTLTRSLRKVS